MLVIRDTQDGTCRLLEGYSYDYDADRLLELNWEIAGELELNQEAKFVDDGAMEFTQCERVVNPHIPANDNSRPNRFCQRAILIIDDGAPEYCSDHEPFHEEA